MAARSERHVAAPSACDDDVIDERHAHGLADGYKNTCQLEVLPAWLGISARVVVHEHESAGAHADQGPQHIGRTHAGAVSPALCDERFAKEVVPAVESDGENHFVDEPSEPLSKDAPDVTGRAERVPWQLGVAATYQILKGQDGALLTRPKTKVLQLDFREVTPPARRLREAPGGSSSAVELRTGTMRPEPWSFMTQRVKIWVRHSGPAMGAIILIIFSNS